jgi:uncharacterized repeat protein (TIGR04138 family)
MLCNECNQHEAKASITQITGNKKTRRYLCAICAQSVTFTPSPRVLSGEMWEYMNPADPLLEIVNRDTRYAIDVYHFVLEACQKLLLDQFTSEDFAFKELFMKQYASGDFARSHISGGQLLEVLRRYALDMFGGKAKSVLNSWGVFKCEDFGDIVFNMIEAGRLIGRPEDTKDDFRGGYNFDTAFPEPGR